MHYYSATYAIATKSSLNKSAFVHIFSQNPLFSKRCSSSHIEIAYIISKVIIFSPLQVVKCEVYAFLGLNNLWKTYSSHPSHLLYMAKIMKVIVQQRKCKFSAYTKVKISIFLFLFLPTIVNPTPINESLLYGTLEEPQLMRYTKKKIKLWSSLHDKIRYFIETLQTLTVTDIFTLYSLSPVS